MAMRREHKIINVIRYGYTVFHMILNFKIMKAHYKIIIARYTISLSVIQST